MSDFNRPNFKKKTCVWTTNYKRLLEMCIVQHVEMKSVFSLQPRKFQVSTTVEKAKPALTRWIFLLRTKNWLLCCFGIDSTYCFAQKTSDYETEKSIFILKEIFPPVTIKHTRTRARKGKNYSIYGRIVSTPDWLIQLTKNSVPFSLYTLSIYSKTK